jgi:hypothetical protein
MVVARASLALTCDSISASQSTLVVVLVPDVVVAVAELVVVAVVVALLTDVMTNPLVREGMGRQRLPAHHRQSLAQQVQQILRHLVGR